MIVDRDYFCGISFVNSTPSSAFSVVDVKCVPGHTIAHEVRKLSICCFLLTTQNHTFYNDYSRLVMCLDACMTRKILNESTVTHTDIRY